MRTRAERLAPAAGFGLMELIIVIGVIAVLVTILSLSIRQIRASFALRHAAEIAMGEVRRAQSSSIAEAVDYLVEFVATNPGILKVYKDSNRDHVFTVGETVPVREVSGQNWPNTIQIPKVADMIGVPPDGTLPVCTDAGVSAGNCVTKDSLYVTFGFFGAPVAAGDVQLKSDTGGTVWIAVEIATGRVSVK